MMKHWTGEAIRAEFLAYFKKKGHQQIPSASLVPVNDPTLLFTNAGMVPFKDVFLGVDQRSYNCAVSSQRCIRAGGKHNDLENVGYTYRHHTFFEMLGNFSFGAYFKREAIEFAWDFLTDVLGLDENRLWVTIHKEDKESEVIWLEEMEVSLTRFSRCDDKDNFWSMGDVGPCGYCTEIFYDHGPEIAGGPPGSPDEDGDRYVEIWNLVFMQFDRDAQGQMRPLPKPCVDTGMGLERITAVMQGTYDNYETDLFEKLFIRAGKLVGCKDHANKSLRVIVDHIRSCAFLIADGILPSNEGRGYVLRRIIRRALRHGHKLGQTDLFFNQLASSLIALMKNAYPELRDAQPLIEQVLKREETNFANTLSNGMRVFEQALTQLSGQKIPGDVVFTLYDTYGFPPDLTADMARERHLTIDEKGFERAMMQQRRQSQAAQQFNMTAMQNVHIEGATQFIGYECMESDAMVTTLLHDQMPVTELHEGEEGVVVLDQTPFYAESGGQVGDSGCLVAHGVHFQVTHTQHHARSVLHIGRLLTGTLHNKATVTAQVDEHRHDVMLNHSATHLLHAALRQILGDHVTQKGSLVDADRLRFDFSHPSALTAEQWTQVEDRVNHVIRANVSAEIQEMTLDEAKAAGAMALFGEKYSDRVRVISMGDFSTELCGGTHVSRTGDIGYFVMTSESACSSGVRRIEAVTGQAAIHWMRKKQQALKQMSRVLKVSDVELPQKIQQLQQEAAALHKLKSEQQRHSMTHQIGGLSEQAYDISGVQVLAAIVEGCDRGGLRDVLDQLRSRFTSYAMVLAQVDQGKIQLVAAVSPDTVSSFKAGDLLNHVAKQVDGKGGGRADFAQGGGTNLSQLPAALESVRGFVTKCLSV